MRDYWTHGDPFSDPPRARVCGRCGALVGDEAAHDEWHAGRDRAIAAAEAVLAKHVQEIAYNQDVPVEGGT